MGVLRQDGLTSSDSAPSTRNVQRIPLAEPVNLDISYKKLSIRLLSLYLLAVIRDPDSERTCQLAALFKEKYIEGISVGRHSLKPFEDLDSEQAHFVGEIVSDSIREFPGFLGKDGDQEVVQAALESMVSVARFTSNAKKESTALLHRLEHLSTSRFPERTPSADASDTSLLKSDLTNALTKITGLETELRRVSAAVAQRPSSQAVPASVDTTQLERRFHSLGFRINELHQLVAGFNTRVERLELAARKAVSLPAVVLQDSEVDSPMAIARVGQSKESDKTIRELRERIAQTEAAIREVRRDFVEDSKGRAGAKPQVSAPATASPVAEGIGAKQILPIPEALARFGESVIAAGGSMPLDVGIAIADELRRLSMRIRLALGAGTAGTVIPSTPPVQDGVLHGIKLNPPVQDVVSMAELSKRLIELKTLNPKMKMEEMAEILTVEFPHNSMGRINARYVETLFTAIYRDHPELKSRSRSKEAVSKRTGISALVQRIAGLMSERNLSLQQMLDELKTGSPSRDFQTRQKLGAFLSKHIYPEHPELRKYAHSEKPAGSKASGVPSAQPPASQPDHRPIIEVYFENGKEVVIREGDVA